MSVQETCSQDSWRSYDQKQKTFTSSIHHQPGRNVHGHQFLEEQLGSVGKLYLENSRYQIIKQTKKPEKSESYSCIPCTPKCCFWGWRWRSGRRGCTRGSWHILVTNTNTNKYKSTPVGVGHLEQPLSEELSGPVRNLTISLHLTEPAEVEIIAD